MGHDELARPGDGGPMRGSLPLRQMSLLPLPSRLPARKHVMAFVFGLVGLSLMMAAVLTASGLGSPFRARGPETVRTGAVVVNEPTTSTTALTAAPVAATEGIRGLGTVPPGPV